MNDNKKKVLTDEELQEVSGGYIGVLINAKTEGANNMTKPCGGYNTKESCEKNPICHWSSDGTCKKGVSIGHFI